MSVILLTQTTQIYPDHNSHSVCVLTARYYQTPSEMVPYLSSRYFRYCQAPSGIILYLSPSLSLLLLALLAPTVDSLQVLMAALALIVAVLLV